MSLIRHGVRLQREGPVQLRGRACVCAWSDRGELKDLSAKILKRPVEDLTLAWHLGKCGDLRWVAWVMHVHVALCDM